MVEHLQKRTIFSSDPVIENKAIFEVRMRNFINMDTFKNTSSQKKIGLFIGFTFAINWLMILAFYLAGGQWKPGNQMVIMGTLYMLIPMSVAYFLSNNLFKEEFVDQMGLRFRFSSWMIFAWLIFPLLGLLIFAVQLAYPGVEFSTKMEGLLVRLSLQTDPAHFKQLQEAMEKAPMAMVAIPAIQAIILGPTINALVAFGEEMGWRGYMYHHTRSMGFWKSSFFIGAVWGIWHAPIILMGHNYPEHPVAGVFMMTIWAMLASPLFQYIRRKSGSVVPAAMAHGTLNAFGAIPLFFIKGGDDLTVGYTGLSGILVLAGVNVILYYWQKPQALSMSFPEE